MHSRLGSRHHTEDDGEVSTLERAIAIAAEAHADTLDKAQAPYVLHPLRVMMALDIPEAQIVGVLHDVVEDSPHWTLERLREESFSEIVLETLDSVTKREDESYDQFIWRAGKHPIGIRVKLADLRDNADLSRFEHPAEEDRERAAKYELAIHRLEARLAIGETRLCAREVQDNALFIERELADNRVGAPLRERIQAACRELINAANEIMVATVHIEINELPEWVELGDSADQTSQRLRVSLAPLKSAIETLHGIVVDLEVEGPGVRVLVGESATNVIQAYDGALDAIEWLMRSGKRPSPN